MTTTKQFTIKLQDNDNGTQEFMLKNEGFEEFELIGILFHTLQKTQLKMHLRMESGEEQFLDKEMD